MKKKTLICMLAIGVIIVLLGLASLANATPSGAYGQPFWNKEQQGTTMLFGSVTCTPSGATFLATSAKYRQSLIIRNRGTVEVFICPVSSAAGLCGDKDEAEANAFNLLENEALVLDKSNNAAGSDGWRCFTFTGTSDVRYFVEEGY